MLQISFKILDKLENLKIFVHFRGFEAKKMKQFASKKVQFVLHSLANAYNFKNLQNLKIIKPFSIFYFNF